MKLTPTRIKSLTRPGFYTDGLTLYLCVEPKSPRGTQSKHWVQRVVIRQAGGPGRRVDIGLGGWPLVSLTEAREQAHANRIMARRGEDPRPTIAARKAVPTFAEACAATEGALTGRSRETRQSALDRYAGRLMDRPVDQIGREDVLRTLTPIWTDKPNMARKLRGWIRCALAWAVGHGHVETNMADVIEGALPKVATDAKHHEAVPYGDVPNVLRMVNESDGSESVKACLAFAILTAVRSGEAREATWNEIDLQAAQWTIPAARMKARQDHVVPLSDAAVGILTALKGDPDDDGPIFPGRKPGKPISRAAMSHLLERLIGKAGTVHGFRSSFRDWAGEETNAARETMEHCLAHRVGNAVEQAYARGSLLAKRRVLMQAWADFATGRATSTVVQFRAG
ncbi:MAG: tyrosine-type recombinase/integrase [Acidobacteria bacterium]|nr:tyrosine-type recombinase/integrase [Acidobacteriota bacterium]